MSTLRVWIVAAVFIAVIWLGAVLLTFMDIDISLQWRAAASAIVILLALAWLVFRRYRAEARAKALEQELLRQSQRQADRSKPDKRAEIEELQQQIQRGISSLKQTKLGRQHGRAALYVLPWYAIVGPPGAGKTTALRSSGLEFPIVGDNGSGLRGIGGTRNCDWWFTNDGILIDTAGRYTTEDNDREEWLAFLSILRKHRPGKPLNGLIVAVAVPDIAQASTEKLHADAAKLRARLDEITTHLDVVLPVYLMFTKTDLVSGFVEFFGDLRKSERDQIFGATLPLDTNPKGDFGALFSTEFKRLLQISHARALRAIGGARQLEARAKLVQFLQEFRSTEDNLTEFVRRLFEHNAYQESPVFRGFYFTSGTQEGRPFERVVDGMARAFGIRVPPSLAQTPEPKSYFVTDLLKRVVFPDQDVAVRTAAQQKRQRWTTLGISVGAGLFAALLILPAIASFLNNRQLISETVAEGAAVKALNWRTQGETASRVPALDKAVERLRLFDSYEEHGVPWPLKWGMYAGDKLAPALRGTYLHSLDDSLVRESQLAMERSLREFGSKTIVQRAEQYATYYDQLKLYLMLSEPQREHLDAAWATDQLTRQWVPARGDKTDDAGPLLRPHVEYYVELLQRGLVEPWKGDAELVSRSRSLLLNVPLDQRLYSNLIQEAERNVPALRHETIFYGAVANFVAPSRNLFVSGAYTKEGWKYVQKRLEQLRSNSAGETWVLGPEAGETKVRIDREIDRVEEQYFKRYQNSWHDFLSDIVVDTPRNSADSAAQLRALSEPEWPYLRLLRALSDNIYLAPPPKPEESLKDKLINQVKDRVEDKAEKKLHVDLDTSGKEDVPPYKVLEDAFGPLAEFGVAKDPKNTTPAGLSQYIQSLGPVVAALDALLQGSAPENSEGFRAALTPAISLGNELTTTQPAYTRTILTNLLIPPLSGSWAGGINDVGKGIGGEWELAVWERWRTQLAPYYPFRKESGQDVQLKSFAEFFRPQSGILWAFYQQRLSGDLRQVGDKFEATRRYNTKIGFSETFMRDCLGTAAQITSVLFPNDGQEPRVDFEVNLHSVSPNVAEVTFEVDGASFDYHNTPERWLRGGWPGADTHSASWRVTGFDKLEERAEQPGDFGFFRLLESGRITMVPGPNPLAFVESWSVRSESTPLELDVRPDRAHVPQLLKLFRQMKCPRLITGS